MTNKNLAEMLFCIGACLEFFTSFVQTNFHNRGKPLWHRSNSWSQTQDLVCLLLIASREFTAWRNELTNSFRSPDIQHIKFRFYFRIVILIIARTLFYRKWRLYFVKYVMPDRRIDKPLGCAKFMPKPWIRETNILYATVENLHYSLYYDASEFVYMSCFVYWKAVSV